MNTHNLKMTGVLALLFLSTTAFAAPPVGVGAADRAAGICYGAIVVGPPGGFVPFLDGTHGVIFTDLGSAGVIQANSEQGNVNLTCHGELMFDEVTAGIDVVTYDGVLGTPVPPSEACEALTHFGLGHACRGANGSGAIIIDPDFRGEPCNIDGVVTYDWRSIFTESGQVMVSCQAQQ